MSKHVLRFFPTVVNSTYQSSKHVMKKYLAPLNLAEGGSITIILCSQVNKYLDD